MESIAENEVLELLSELVRWNKFQGHLKAKEALADILKKQQDLLVYHFSDGRGSQEVGKITGVSHVTVTTYWKKWAGLGIVEPIKVPGGTRYRRSFSLEALGMEVPDASSNPQTFTQGAQ